MKIVLADAVVVVIVVVVVIGFSRPINENCCCCCCGSCCLLFLLLLLLPGFQGQSMKTILMKSYTNNMSLESAVFSFQTRP